MALGNRRLVLHAAFGLNHMQDLEITILLLKLPLFMRSVPSV